MYFFSSPTPPWIDYLDVRLMVKEITMFIGTQKDILYFPFTTSGCLTKIGTPVLWINEFYKGAKWHNVSL